MDTLHDHRQSQKHKPVQYTLVGNHTSQYRVHWLAITRSSRKCTCSGWQSHKPVQSALVGNHRDQRRSAALRRVANLYSPPGVRFSYDAGYRVTNLRIIVALIRWSPAIARGVMPVLRQVDVPPQVQDQVIQGHSVRW